MAVKLAYVVEDGSILTYSGKVFSVYGKSILVHIKLLHCQVVFDFFVVPFRFDEASYRV